MATFDITDDLYAQLQAKAEAEGKTVDDLMLEAIQDRLTRESFTAKVTRFREKNARGINYTPEQVSDIVHDWRKEQHGR
jgi:predicted transcriptional regulator